MRKEPRDAPADARRQERGNAEALHVLWRGIAAYSAAETDEALRHLMKWIAQAIDADNVIWIGGVRVLRGAAAKKDPFMGWRLRAREALRPDPPAYQRQLAAYYDREHYGKLTPTYYDRSHEAHDEAHIGLDSRATMSTTGRFRVFRQRDGWFDFAAFRRTLHYKLYYLDSGIVDRILVGFPISPGRESFLLIDRFQKPGGPRRRHFSKREAELAGSAARGLPELHRRLFLDTGLMMGDKVLSPTERQILRGLLTGQSEKELAIAMGQKPATLHKYVTALYARYGVSSRAAFMALWLRGFPATPSI
jgi:DNA-binding CsgD family transcriptional regulator